MKFFDSYQEFAFTTIKENLTIIDLCLKTVKRQGTDSCYGMSALVLIASVIDTIGTFYRNGTFSPISDNDVKNNNLGKVSEHFIQFHKKFCGDECSQDQFIGQFYMFARCRATHNGVLGPKVKITKRVSKSGKFLICKQRNKKEYTTIYLNELFAIVKNAFSQMCSEESIPSVEEKYSPTTGGTSDCKYE